ncbi:response regulator [Streptomyces monticola]|uniref:Response regulator n=1 Tax=Streptomyces monticola TaxID=2666263 RepID=A0ABW2JI76_9ACTN
MSQHTSAYTTPPRSEHTPAQVPVPAPVSPPGQAPPALRVVVADDNPVVRAGLTALLGARDDIHVVAEAADGREALARAREHRPDVVLLDVRMPGVDGISALPHLVRVAPVMMLTYSRENTIVREALRLGADGYLVHGEFTAEQLVAAVRDVRDGRAHFTASAQGALLAHVRDGAPTPAGLPEGLGHAYGTEVPPSAPPPEPPVSIPHQLPVTTSHVQPVVPESERRENRREFGLSTREVEVMGLIAAGMNNQQIAATCFISEKTVKNHINRIFAKLHSTSRSEAIAVWLGTARGRSTR